MKQRADEALTNEALKNKFISQFALVNYAIKLATHRIASGTIPLVDYDTQSLPMQILAEIVEGKDVIEDIKSS